MKTVNEVLGKIKGEDKVNEVLTGKGSFSKSGFADTVNALVNDTTFGIKAYDKDGNVTGTINISEMIRSDIKKSIENAKYPQKSEVGVLDSSEIVTKGLAEAIPYIVMEQMKAGKKFDLPNNQNVVGSIYLADVPGKVRETEVRDILTKENLGTSITTTKDSVQIRTKSPVPNSCIVSKVRKDVNGNVIKN